MSFHSVSCVFINKQPEEIIFGHDILIFFHLDCHHRLWNFTRSALSFDRARGLNRRLGFSPCPED